MAHRQSYKEEPGVGVGGDHVGHHPHHAQQGPPPPHHLQQANRPPSIVHQQHHQAPPPPQHPNAYPQQTHGLPQYPQSAPGPQGQHQELPYYTTNHASPYSTPSASGTYSSAGPETPDIMAATHIQRPYPPIYHTPQSNSPASVASPSAQEQQRMYGGPSSQLQQNPQMYYPAPQQHYPPPMAQAQPSPYAQQQQPQQQPQQHPSMTSQPNNLLMSHQPQHPMQQHPSQHQQPGMTGSPRTKMEPHVPQIPRSSAPLGPPQQQQQPHPQNGTPQMNQNNIPGGANAGGNNAAPGPIPATTPLVVRQDNNGVQWIAFEYSRDRVKMEYTIRCDVESVNVETLGPEFKTENCVYPRACCSKDQYRGNRLVYETECNTVGWALAELNPCLRGKRGLIQRAVDSWRNSNQDPRLRSRRVRRMAKINNRKAVQAATTHNPHMAGPGGPTGMPPSGNMGPGSAGNMGKPGLGGMGQLHHHHAHPDGSTQGGEDVGDDEYMDEQHHHHHQAPNGQPSGSPDDVRQANAFPGYPGSYPPNPSVGGASMAPSLHDRGMHGSSNPIAARSSRRHEDDNTSLFGDIPEAKRRKFILVDDPAKGARVRVRVTLDAVDINEIPDSFRKSNSVYPRSWFPMQMQSPPPSAHGSRFFGEDDNDEVEAGRPRGRKMVSVPLANGEEGQVPVPALRKSMRSKEVKLNDLGYRMTWHQSRVFADKTVFLQKALDAWRNKVNTTITSAGRDVQTVAPHFETRAGKRRWAERSKREKGGAASASASES